jgi:hypothetical protein
MGGFTAKNHNWRSFFRRCIPEIHAVLGGFIYGHPRASLWPLNAAESRGSDKWIIDGANFQCRTLGLL